MKLVRETDALTVSVEPGMADGHTITFFEEGEPIIDGEILYGRWCSIEQSFAAYSARHAGRFAGHLEICTQSCA